MNRISSLTLTAASAILFAGLAACGERTNTTTTQAGEATKPESSAVVIGQAPAPPSGDPPGTTPVAGNTSELSKSEERTQQPQEGDNHSYSTLAPKTPQKANGENIADQRSKP
jgi:hypothetical protein